MNHRRRVCLALITVAAGAPSCKSLYYSTMESIMGKEKRDILVDRIEDARDEQAEAKDEFRSALEKFKTVANVELGALEDKYNELRTAFERSEAKANRVRKDIESVEEVASDLFSEWDGEIEEIGNPKLEADSKRLLEETKGRYERLIGLMRKAEQKIEPVLGAFRGQVLFLKHNLNAKAIAALQGNLEAIETDVQALLQEMERSIEEANAFIATETAT